ADNFGYVNSVDEAHKLIAEFETGLTTKFSFFKAVKVTKYWGKMHEIFKEQKFVFYWCAFQILGRKVFNCQHGIDRTAGEKRKRKDAEEAGNKDFVFKKIRFLVQDTRKFDCKAQIKMREILFFSENKV
ncbi:unnamed protein product, partial [Pocillopora meandrina]